jgi:hypothetical protein
VREEIETEAAGQSRESRRRAEGIPMSTFNAIHKLGRVLLVLAVGVLVFSAAPAMAELSLSKFVISARNEDGTPDVQAGSHPYALTTTFAFNEAGPKTGYLKDVNLELPPGFVGNPNATPKCSYQEFDKQISNGGPSCASETAVGLATTYLKRYVSSNVVPTTSPVYNLVPPAGVAAEFGYVVAESTPVLLRTSVRTGTDYGLTTSVADVNQAVVVDASKVTIWGIPSAEVHNKYRGRCEEVIGGAEIPPEEVGIGLREGEDEIEGSLYPYFEKVGGLNAIGLPESLGECPTEAPDVPLLTNPTSCGQPRTATLSVDSWDEPGNFKGPRTRTASLPELSGCEKLSFSPTIGMSADGSAGSTPTGLNVKVHVPQETTENPVGLAEADVKNTTVALPAGVQLSPSAADGLQGCSEAEIGFEGYKELDDSGVQSAIYRPRVYDEATKQEEPSLCPDASKVANVRIKTPLLEGEFTGSVYLASPQNFQGVPENPFSSLIALYLVAEEPRAGVLVKVAGRTLPCERAGQVLAGRTCEVAGQLITSFENTPQLPYSDLALEFFGTDRAPLATPALCGAYRAESSFEPWSGTPAVEPTSSFKIESGPNGSACTYPGQSLPFSPVLTSGSPNVDAGGFSALTTTLSREDGQQQIQQITLHYPAGLSGLLSGVKLCGEAEANAGTCGVESQIGETIVSVGLGNDPYSVTGGKVYLTGPYEGAPFGLSIVNPAKAGPFDLQEGRPVIVRAKIEVNPLTAALTVTTTGEIPHIIDGIPLQIKHINVNITRSGFTFNPTNCEPMKVEGTVTSAEGASALVSDPFQVTNCANLKFAPKFAVSTSGKTSKADGASLTVKLSEPSEPQGSQANISKVKVELPKQLPSRLTTLQKACTDKQFEANPEACPSESKIGYATVHTPLLPVPLSGPAIFVSHGGEAFPSLTMVLKGYGITVDLVGTTFISKAGVTSTTFKTVPDVPFNTFELTLPQGKYSALGTNYNLCSLERTVTTKKTVKRRVDGKTKRVTESTSKTVAETLQMPTEFIAQNGASINETTTVGVTGCPKTSKATKTAKKKGKGKGKKK